MRLMCERCQALEAERDQLREQVAVLVSGNARYGGDEARDQLSALQAQYAELAAERDQWRTVAGDFHNALVGHGMAGAFNQRLCRQAVRLFDVLNAKHGIGHPEDVAEIREQIRGAEAQLSALQAVLAEIEPYLQHKGYCPAAYDMKWARIRHVENHLDVEAMDECPDPVCRGWQWGQGACTCGLDTRLAGLREIR